MLLNFILYSQMKILLDLVSRILHSCSMFLIYFLPLDFRATQFLGFPLILLITSFIDPYDGFLFHNIEVFQSFIIGPLFMLNPFMNSNNLKTLHSISLLIKLKFECIIFLLVLLLILFTLALIS